MHSLSDRPLRIKFTSNRLVSIYPFIRKKNILTMVSCLVSLVEDKQEVDKHLHIRISQR